MAYRKFKRSRRSSGRFRRRFRRSFGRRVRRIAYSIAEKKYYQYALYGGTSGATFPITTAVSNPMTSTGTYEVSYGATPRSLVNTIPLGFSDGQRIGNKVFVEYVQLSFYVQFGAPEADAMGGSMAVNGCVMRYGLYYDKQAGGGATPLIGLYEPMGGSSQWTYGAFRGKSTLGKYKTLRDKQIRVAYSSTAATAGGSGIPAVQEYIPIKRTFSFASASTDTTLSNNMLRNDLALVVSCNHNTSCYIWIGVRVCYRDA